MHIGLYGLSGSGKSHLSQKLRETHKDYIFISASSLIKNTGHEISPDRLSPPSIARNQEILAREITTLTKNHGKTLLELHAVIETSNGIELIDPAILASFPLDKIYYLNTRPEEIKKRRDLDKSKRRAPISIEKIQLMQNITIDSLVKAYGNDNIEFVSSENAEGLISKYISLTNQAALTTQI